MKINLNEKLWFGKYNGERIKKLINDDPNHIKKLIDDGSLILTDDAYLYFTNRIDEKKSKYHSRWSSYSTFYDESDH